MTEAVSLGLGALAEQSHYRADDWTLTAAQRIYLKGKYVWLITFKPTSLLPADPATQAIGAGGEVFVKVYLKTKKTVVTYGE